MRRTELLSYLLSLALVLGSVACGAATGVGVVEEVGNDGGGHDAARKLADSGLDASCEAVPSCGTGTDGVNNCGASGESCCTSLEVRGGTYYRTYVNDGSGPTGETDLATVSGFRLDKYLVTVGRFRQFVCAWKAGWRPREGTGKHTHLNAGLGLSNSARPDTYEPGWLESDDTNVLLRAPFLDCAGGDSTWTASAGDNETRPINCMNWYDAYAFCIWDGGFLPSDAEWGYAAAGGSQQREYPWGSTDPGTNNQYAIYDCHYPDARGRNCPVQLVSNIAPVGTATLGAGLWGQVDLEGEVTEFALDWYAPYLTPCTDCADMTAPPLSACGPARVIRGAGSDALTSYMLVPSRSGVESSTLSPIYGFRCARTP